MTFLAIDQYGQDVPLHTEHPRKELLEHFGVKSARKMYTEYRDHDAHTGYIISGRWFRVFGIEGRKFAKRMPGSVGRSNNAAK